MRTRNNALSVLLVIALFVVIFYFGIPIYRDWKAGEFRPSSSSKGDVSIEGGSLGGFSEIDLPGEIEEASCSWLENCSITKVPKGTFTATFKKVGPLDEARCEWHILSEGEYIDYTIIDEFMTFKGSIPSGVETFVKEISQTVWACQAHTTTEIKDRDTYYPQYSCSDMSKCRVVKVPIGTFTVGFEPIIIDGRRDCTTIVWSEGQTISYGGISEIHTYDVDLPYFTMEAFIASQKPFVASCN